MRKKSSSSFFVDFVFSSKKVCLLPVGGTDIFYYWKTYNSRQDLKMTIFNEIHRFSYKLLKFGSL